ncbi:hypothetical protein F8M41_012675 [Gigaspora margarita]|uniref:Uncharacterized protein n=1 Tax=Gigaspora margarita TaxID=4874 RepID=A0A8H3WZB4_GIGMA|nr:hypothetical protein F8M41_012675 [Gigaspora margarita]
MLNKATLNTFSTNINSLTQVVNEAKSILTSDIKNQFETAKNSINSLKCRFDIYEQNQNEFITSMRIKIQHIEGTLTSITTILENLSTSTSVLQTTMEKTNEKWNEATITEIAEAYFKTLKKERKTTPAMKLQNDLRARRPLTWMSDEGNRIHNLADDVINQTQVEKLNSGGRHSYATPMPLEIIKMDDPRWTNMQSLIPAKPKNLPIWAWNQVDSNEYFDDIYDDE